jgi:hypothetical protein
LTAARLAAFLLALLLSGLLVPYVMKLAVHFDAIDKPTAIRKLHRHDMPLWGGLAVWASFFLTAGFLWLSGSPLAAGLDRSFIGIFFGGTFIVLVGMVDDKKGLPPKLKLLGQLLAGLILVLSGIRMHGLNLPFIGYWSLSPFWGSLGAMFWVVLLVNAFNFVDGLDGLSGGIGLIVALTLSLIALKVAGPSQESMALMQVAVCGLVLSGALLGFLFYNFNPDLHGRYRQSFHRFHPGRDHPGRNDERRRRPGGVRADPGPGHSPARHFRGGDPPPAARTADLQGRPEPFAPHHAENGFLAPPSGDDTLLVQHRVGSHCMADRTTPITRDTLQTFSRKSVTPWRPSPVYGRGNKKGEGLREKETRKEVGKRG